MATVDDIVGVNPFLKAWTPVKVRVTYQTNAGNLNTFDADVGTGVTLQVPPTNKVDVDVLVPLRAGIQELIDNGSAPPLQGAALALLDFATTVICKATCVAYGNPVAKPRYTDLVYIDNQVPAGTNGVALKLQPYASNVQLLATAFAGSGALVIGDIDATLRFEVVKLPQGTAIDTLSALFPRFNIPFIGSPDVSEKVDIPRPHANVVRVQSGGLVVPKRANVLVSQELFC